MRIGGGRPGAFAFVVAFLLLLIAIVPTCGDSTPDTSIFNGP